MQDDENDDIMHLNDKNENWLSSTFNNANGDDSNDSDSLLRKSSRQTKKPTVLDEFIIDAMNPVTKPKLANQKRGFSSFWFHSKGKIIENLNFDLKAVDAFARKSTSFRPKNVAPVIANVTKQIPQRLL